MAVKKDESVKVGDKPIRVRATMTGYYGYNLRRAGDVFTIKNEKAFSSKWMERVSDRAQERVSTAQEAINQKKDELVRDQAALKANIGNGGTGNQDLI
jgi:hypothetical protein